jgi:hypothetical protein
MVLLDAMALPRKLIYLTRYSIRDDRRACCFVISNMQRLYAVGFRRFAGRRFEVDGD